MARNLMEEDTEWGIAALLGKRQRTTALGLERSGTGRARCGAMTRSRTANTYPSDRQALRVT